MLALVIARGLTAPVNAGGPRAEKRPIQLSNLAHFWRGTYFSAYVAVYLTLSGAPVIISGNILIASIC